MSDFKKHLAEELKDIGTHKQLFKKY